MQEFLKTFYELITVLSPLFTNEDLMQNPSTLLTFDDLTTVYSGKFRVVIEAVLFRQAT